MKRIKIFCIHCVLTSCFYLNISLEVAGDQRPQTSSERQTIEVWEDHCGVEDGGVDQVEGPEIILQSMTHEDGVGVEETHQVILDFFDVLVLTRHCNTDT